MTSYFPPSTHNGKTLDTWHYTNENYTHVSATYVGEEYGESVFEDIMIEVN